MKDGANMKLNPDCVRDILLTIESETDYNSGINFEPKKSEFPLLAKYSPNELFYHLRQCDLSAFFYKSTVYLDATYHVRDLTPYAHEFLANIRSENNWEKVKSISKKVGSNSLDSIKQIAVGVIGELIKGQFL